MSCYNHRSCLVLFLGIVFVSQGQFPKVSIELLGTSHYVMEGHSVIFNCHTRNSSTDTGWTKNAERLNNSYNYRIHNSSLTVHFRQAQEGNYSCFAGNDMGIIASRSITLSRVYIETHFYSTNARSPRIFTRIAGLPTFLNCGTFSSKPDGKVNWRKYINLFVSINLDPKKEVAAPDGNLFLLEPKLEDSGTVYSCQAMNTFIADRYTGYIKVIVADNPDPPSPLRVWIPPQNKIVVPGAAALFSCVPGGRGARQANINWTYPESVEPHISNNRYQLLVWNISSLHAGIYACHVEGQTYSANLSLLEAPVLTSNLSPVISLTHSEALRITCSATSKHSFWWEWFFNGTRLMNNVGGTLHIPYVSTAHQGTFQCIARNEAGYDQSATLIHVAVVEAKFSRLLPSMVVAFRGQDFTIHCMASGLPHPHFTWYKLITNGTKITSEEEYLNISKIEFNDAGAYQCIARTVLHGDIIVKEIIDDTNIAVIQPTTLVVEERSRLETQIGSTIELSCAVNHSSKADVSFQWLKDKELLNNNNHLMLVAVEQDLQLIIQHVRYEDEGRYQCVVRTTLNGFEAPKVWTSNLELIVMGNPPVPKIQLLTATSHNSFVVRWFYFGKTSEVSHYMIQVKKPFDSMSLWSSIMTLLKNTTSTVYVSSPMLMGYTTYGVRVVLVLVDGSSIFGMPRTLRTRQSVPLGPPRDFQVQKLNGTSLQITWKPPEEPQGPIWRYVIQYKKTGGLVQTVYVDGGIQRYILAGLENQNTYDVEVAAETEVGRGPFALKHSFLVLPISNLLHLHSSTFLILISVLMSFKLVNIVSIWQ